MEGLSRASALPSAAGLLPAGGPARRTTGFLGVERTRQIGGRWVMGEGRLLKPVGGADRGARVLGVGEGRRAGRSPRGLRGNEALHTWKSDLKSSETS